MASVYTNEDAIEARIGEDRLTVLLDRDNSGTADTGVLTASIERAGRIIDRRLRQRYGSAIPFAQYGASPDTPDAIKEIAIDLVLADLYGWIEPTGRDALQHEKDANDALTALADGKEDIPVARASASDGRYIAVYEASEDPTFAGVDECGVSRTRGI